MKHAAPDGGFTLLEVLVALAIVGLVLPPLLMNAAARINGLKVMEDTLIANQVAQNQLSVYRLDSRLNSARPPRSESGVETMAGRDWFWRVTSEPAGLPGAFRMEIAVGEERAPDRALVEVAVFFAVQ